MIVHRLRLLSYYSSVSISYLAVVILLVVGIAITSRVSYAFIHLPSSMSKYQSSMQMNDSSDILSAGRESMEPLQTNDNVNTKDVYEDNNPPKRRGRPGIVVFSGGTAFNAASAEMASRAISNSNSNNNLDSSEAGISRSNSMSSLMDLMASGSIIAEDNDNININQQQRNGGGTKVWHILPVTDDGGSTAEIVRILGGPAVGDIRSRLLRLAPGTTREARAVRRLLGHRLISNVDDDDNVDDAVISRMAREEWLDILDGGQESYYQSTNTRVDDDVEQSYEHPLWKDVSAPYRSIIRAYLVHFHTQVLQRHNGIRQSQSQPAFNFRGGSIGNFFFAGARIFFGSLPAAIFLFSKVAGIPSGSRVVPAVLTEDRLVLGAELQDGTRIRGQFNISHPRPKESNDTKDTAQHENEHRQVIKKSSEVASLHSSPIQRISYLLNDPTWRKNNQQQHTQSFNGSSIQQQQQQWSSRNEITPEPNPQVLDAISNANCIVYGCGSLFTSVLPSLVLDGVGSAISSRYVYKVLLLNGWHDCETSWVETNEEDGSEQVVKQMNANSIVQAVINALNQDGDHNSSNDNDEDNGSIITTDYITHIFYPIGTEIDIDEQALLKLGIEVRGIESIPANTCSEGSRSGVQSYHVVYDTKCLVDALLSLAIT